jgi:8-amino-7-oxononanoate synthase
MNKTCNPLLEKAIKYKDPEQVRAMGLYPYFRPIESDQDTEVLLGVI